MYFISKLCCLLVFFIYFVEQISLSRYHLTSPGSFKATFLGRYMLYTASETLEYVREHERHLSGFPSHCRKHIQITALIARFMGPTWGPSGADRTQVGPMLAPWTLQSGSTYIYYSISTENYELSWCQLLPGVLTCGITACHYDN